MSSNPTLIRGGCWAAVSAPESTRQKRCSWVKASGGGSGSCSYGPSALGGPSPGVVLPAGLASRDEMRAILSSVAERVALGLDGFEIPRCHSAVFDLGRGASESGPSRVSCRKTLNFLCPRVPLCKTGLMGAATTKGGCRPTGRSVCKRLGTVPGTHRPPRMRAPASWLSYHHQCHLGHEPCHQAVKVPWGEPSTRPITYHIQPRGVGSPQVEGQS